MSIDNALLKQKQSNQEYQYQVGGSLLPGNPTYIKRQADIDLYKALKQGDFCYIFNARQMGKSSLRVQIISQLKAEGVVCCSVDVTEFISRDFTEEQWYLSIIYRINEELSLINKKELFAWWKELSELSAVQRFNEFIKTILLETIVNQNIVIFLDEIDSILNLNFNPDNFFAAIRYLYNQRADYPS
ncbi:MAG: hypothetical protein HC908_18775 [Calothrix sp. SM1_7_51]|nr:hypothetical protein [Calothrix sp. SM1_7_51]